ncbi:MAG: hypothetical protein IPN46_20145 [Saprospiraceae bacterium]|nr:hypothetical protein [Saprospiraceae bacterium]
MVVPSSTLSVWGNQTTDPMSQSNLTHFDMYIPASGFASGDFQLMFNSSQYGDDWYFLILFLDAPATRMMQMETIFQTYLTPIVITMVVLMLMKLALALQMLTYCG